MYAVIVQVKIDTNRDEQMRTALNQEVVPTARQLPGFASGTWLQALDGDHGTAVLVFDSQQAARAAAGRLRATVHGMADLRPVGPVADVPVFTVETVGAYQVVAQAPAGEMTSSASMAGVPAGPLPGGRARTGHPQEPAHPAAAFPRPNGAPAYYQGRPARLWITALSRRRKRTPSPGDTRPAGPERRATEN